MSLTTQSVGSLGVVTLGFSETKQVNVALCKSTGCAVLVDHYSTAAKYPQ